MALWHAPLNCFLKMIIIIYCSIEQYARKKVANCKEVNNLKKNCKCFGKTGFGE
jgi:hypothetical protein